MNSNPHSQLVTQIISGERVLTYDFDAFQVGVAEYPEGPTGCTVFYFPEGVKTAVDVRGGHPGLSHSHEFNYAICFAGGSLLGLEAVSGVVAGLFARNGYSFEQGFPLVSGAVIYDFAKRDNTVYPNLTLGQAALEAAKSNRFPLGPHGAGRSATVGGIFNDDWQESSGQGAAFKQIGPVKIAVFTVVNACGCVYDRKGNIVRGNMDVLAKKRVSAKDDLEKRLTEKAQTSIRTGNSTLTLVVTNLKLHRHELEQVARQVHHAIARVIQPFATIDDGDVLYAVTTHEVEHIGPTSLGILASELAWDALLSIYKG